MPYPPKTERIQFGIVICDQSWPQNCPKQLSVELAKKKRKRIFFLSEKNLPTACRYCSSEWLTLYWNLMHFSLLCRSVFWNYSAFKTYFQPSTLIHHCWIHKHLWNGSNFAERPRPGIGAVVVFTKLNP